MRYEKDLHYFQKKNYVGIRVLGGLMVLMVAAIAMLVFFNFSSENAASNTLESQQGETTNAAETEKNSSGDGAKYSFYEQLQERSKEVQKEIDHQRQMTENRKPIKGRNYRVQVGAFRNPDQAERMLQNMLLMKLPTRIIRSGEFHLVQVGPYATLEDAEKIQKVLEEDNVKTLIKTFVDN